MNPIKRLLNRMRFRKHLTSNQSVNVVDGMVKARLLYKELAVKAHPDRHPGNIETAEELMQRINNNRFNYSALLKLKAETEEKLL